MIDAEDAIASILTAIVQVFRKFAAHFLVFAVAMVCSNSFAVDLTFNINPIPGGEANPFPPDGASNFAYGDVWAENGYVYVGSDRGIDNSSSRRGVSIFSINNAGIPTFLPPPTSPPAGYAATTYFGSEMEDIEVYDGIGYFSSDVLNPSGERTGVDIVDLSIPFDPVMLSRVDSSDCLSGSPTVCAHGKVHTVSIQRFNPGTPTEQRFLYTSDNSTDIIKITNVSDSANPILVASLDINAPSGVASHEVVVRNNRLYVASKSSSTSTNGWFHIYDVSNPANPVFMKAFLSGASTHTAMPTYDGNTLIVAEERSNGNVKIYDISNINSPNDPDNPILKKSLIAADLCHSGSCVSSFSPHHIHVHGNLVFLPWYDAGLVVLNISNPANPVMVGAFDTWSGSSTTFNGNWGVDLSLGLNRVLLSDRKRGLIVVDATGVVAAGDFNQDMVVNDTDYNTWRASFGSTGSSVHDAPLADGNYNGIVDAADYVIWRKHKGETGPSGAAAIAGESTVPEPASVILLAAGIGLLVARRRGRTSAFPG